MTKAARKKRKTEGDVRTAQLSPTTSRRRWLPFVLVSGAFVLFLAVFLLRVDPVVGLIVDDAWYVLLAKAIATGQGYTLINSPTPGIRPFYSPGFPALLAVFYKLWPHFPENVYLLKSVSMTAMLGVGILVYLYFRRERRLPFEVALGIAVATALYPALVFLATSSVMSECVFMLFQLGAIVAVERCVLQRRSEELVKEVRVTWLPALIGGLLSSFALLTRPAGVGLLLASVAYLAKARLWRSAIIYAATCALLVGPWILYSSDHRSTPEQRAEQAGNIVQSYAVQFWQRTAGQPLSGTITLDEVPERVWTNISEIAKNDIGAVVFYSMFRPLEPSVPVRVGEAARFLSYILALLALAGFVSVLLDSLTLAELVVPLSLLVSMLWGWEQFRLILPIIPFLIFYLLMGLRLVLRLVQRFSSESSPTEHWQALAVAVWLIVVSDLYSHVIYIQKKYDPVVAKRLLWISTYDENVGIIRHAGETLPKEAIIATQNPALLNLYTGQKTVASDDPAGHWEIWDRLGVRYIVRTSATRLPNPDVAESKYRVIYHEPGVLNLRIVDMDIPSRREPWSTAGQMRPRFP